MCGLRQTMQSVKRKETKSFAERFSNLLHFSCSSSCLCCSVCSWNLLRFYYTIGAAKHTRIALFASKMTFSGADDGLRRLGKQFCRLHWLIIFWVWATRTKSSPKKRIIRSYNEDYMIFFFQVRSERLSSSFRISYETFYSLLLRWK